jgi:uncharacterized membrane protein YfcA
MNKNKISLFDSKQVRQLWDDEAEKWWFSVVDVIEILSGQPMVPLTVLLAPLGTWIGSKLDSLMLKRVFAIFLLISGSRMLMQVLGF